MFRSQERTLSSEMDAPNRAKASATPPPLAQSLLHMQRRAGNAAVSALLARSGTPVALQRQPAPADDILTAKGPQDQARDDVNNAVLIASNWLALAIKNRDNNAPLPAHIFRAYNRFFSGADLNRLDLLKTTVDDVLKWIAGIPFDVIPNPIPPGYRDEKIHNAGLTMPGLLAAAIQPDPKGKVATSGDIYIAIYPPWFAADPKMRAGVVLHELFHYFPGLLHDAKDPWKNARAYQGFVMTAAGLPELPGITAMFPP